MSQGEGQRCGPTHDLPFCIVLGSMAGALELVLGTVPRHHTSQVCADSVDPVVGQGPVVLHHDIGGISFESLGQ
eukprot:scaffold76_cov363-Pavlova_lutheri.AAC.12